MAKLVESPKEKCQFMQYCFNCNWL